jgi:hypothetical protein
MDAINRPVTNNSCSFVCDLYFRSEELHRGVMATVLTRSPEQ